MWERGVDTVKFLLVAIDPSREIRRWKLMNIANGVNRELGVLTLSTDEVRLLEQGLHPGPVQQYYQSWIYERMTNPEKYQVNGKPLCNMDCKERMDLLNTMWNSSRPLDSYRKKNDRTRG